MNEEMREALEDRQWHLRAVLTELVRLSETAFQGGTVNELAATLCLPANYVEDLLAELEELGLTETSTQKREKN
jgi:DNA-binding IscR family transcriptional regulator